MSLSIFLKSGLTAMDVNWFDELYEYEDMPSEGNNILGKMERMPTKSTMSYFSL